jgi:thiazole synthase ThiGH ThiG subunit
MQTKKRNKKYNPLKNLINTANQVLKNYAVGYITSHKSSDFIDIKRNKKVSVNMNTVKLLTEIPHMWSVYIACFGRDENNIEYMKSKEIHIDQKYLQKDVVATLNNIHSKMCKQFNQKHFISAGWIATPYYKEWKESEASELFTELGAYLFIKDKN